MAYVLLALAYLLGATPSSYWAGRVGRRLDLREHGSGNLGATNAYRVLGWRWALPVVLADMGKGFLPAWLFPGLAGVGPVWALFFGAAAILGHMFSFWVGFRGGKGVATSAGVFLALAPWAFLGALVVWGMVTFATRYVSLGSIAAAVALPLFVWLTPPEEGTTPGLLGFTIGLAAFVVWKHRANLRRLAAGEENRIGPPPAPPQAPATGEPTGVAAPTPDPGPRSSMEEDARGSEARDRGARPDPDAEPSP
jgi:glycerol-3-phosphate acyltransferase PlsY